MVENVPCFPWLRCFTWLLKQGLFALQSSKQGRNFDNMPLFSCFVQVPKNAGMFCIVLLWMRFFFFSIMHVLHMFIHCFIHNQDPNLLMLIIWIWFHDNSHWVANGSYKIHPSNPLLWPRCVLFLPSIIEIFWLFAAFCECRRYEWIIIHYECHGWTFTVDLVVSLEEGSKVVQFH